MLPQVESFTSERILRYMDAGELTKVVNRAMSETVTVKDWQVTLLGGLDSSPMAGGVYRVGGRGVSAANVTKEWSVVVKILH